MFRSLPRVTLLPVLFAAGCGGRTLGDIELPDAGATSLPAEMAMRQPVGDAGRLSEQPDAPDGKAAVATAPFASDAGVVVQGGAGAHPTATGKLQVGASVPGPGSGGPGLLLLAVDPFGNIVVAGATRDVGVAGADRFPSGVTAQAFVAKLSSQGTPQWAMPLAFAGQPEGLGVDSKGHIIVIANYRSTTNPIGIGNDTSALYVAKLDASGAMLFDEHIDFDDQSFNIGGLAVASDDSLYIAGSLMRQGGRVSERPILEHLDALGNRLFSSVYFATRSAHAAAVAAASNGDAVMTGYFDETVDLGGGKLTSTARAGKFSSLNGFVARYSSTGAHVFSARFGGPSFDIGAAVTVDAANDILLGGAFTGPGVVGTQQVSSNEGALLARLDASGTARWARVLPGTMRTTRRIAVDATGKGYVAGQLGGSIYLRTIDASGGTIVDRKTLTGSTDTTDVAIGKDGSIWITGTFDKTVDLGQGQLTGGPASYLARLAP